ncbi:hypothetical protein ACFO3J_11560 [Streptomyces polygonati]|uniref:Resolvase/invertase-type recombinase catalytic domain-containing protein n=1 Tax=Streptomyces polygonati TaxID=1617087 RepID=A0ABV8HKI8_9ACTN
MVDQPPGSPSGLASKGLSMHQPKPDPIAAVAYLRRLPNLDEEAVRKLITALVAFSVEQGFGLAGVHFEEGRSQRLDTWMELITECRSEGVVNVLVPDSDHFHHAPAVAAFMREELAEKIRGTVWLMHEAGGAATTETTVPDVS